MELLGDRAEFMKRGRGPDKRPRKRRSTQIGVAGGTIASGSAIGYGASAMGRELKTRKEVGRAVRQVREDYRKAKGKYPARGKVRALRKNLRESYKQHNAVKSVWKGADDVFDYEIIQPRSPFGFPKGRKVISKAPVRAGALRRAGSRLAAAPGGRAALLGAAGGALAYGGYRGLRALDGRR